MLRVAFDLDDTLIPSDPTMFLTERPGRWWGRWFLQENCRRGTNFLLSTLARQCELWVYTTSLRTPTYVRFLFRAYGGKLAGVVNAERHMRWLRKQAPHMHCSKYPPAYGIDLLIDDSEGVVMEGLRMGYRVLHVRPDEENWCEKILQTINGRA